MNRKFWIAVGVVIAIVLLLYWLFMAETLEETVAMVSQTAKSFMV
ncbi:hypothetical protein [Bacteroides sp. 51]|nr:hypothetical protein [Bacteroides sp. 51]